VADPLLSLSLAVAVPALSVASAALMRRWTARLCPDPAVAALEAKLERRCERIALAQGKHQDAFKSWKVGGHG
jgi:hypothetical protein